jgi:hypothetical protein
MTDFNRAWWKWRFFVDLLANVACSYPSLDLNATTATESNQHHFGFDSCSPNQLVEKTSGYGSW